MKHAVIKPMLKQLGMELIKNNYRPVSNLSFISKLIESVVVQQLTDHMDTNDLQDPRQSAYKKHHSTETLLLKVQNDILMNMDKGQVTMMVLLDLSAAFDTIDHDILIERLEKRYGVTDTALRWFRSYLSDRTQSVCMDGQESDKLPLLYGVPQGSKLGPILFNAYIAPLSDAVKKHGIEDQKYADDEGLLMAFSPKLRVDQMNAREQVIDCITEIRDFLDVNKLSNNGKKTEFMISGSAQQLKKLEIDSIEVGGITIKAVDHVRNLGVIFDQHMSMGHQVRKICKTGYFHLRNISSVRNNINKKDTKTLTHAFVTSVLDNGNSLLHGISKKHLNKLQVLQNSAARVVERKRKFDHITEARKELHWLPVEARIKFKTLDFVWKSLNGMAPKYLINKPKRVNPRDLRNKGLVFLETPRFNRPSFGGRAFENVAPRLWNELPSDIRQAETNNQFRSKLKTHLFTQYYD